MAVGTAASEGNIQISKTNLVVFLSITQKPNTDERNFSTNVRYAFDLKLLIFRCGFKILPQRESRVNFKQYYKHVRHETQVSDFQFVLELHGTVACN